jgi:uncharacterized membrane protein (Fun14 family)
MRVTCWASESIMVLGLALGRTAARASALDHQFLVRAFGAGAKSTSTVRTLRLLSGGSLLGLAALSASGSSALCAAGESGSDAGGWRSIVPGAAAAGDGGNSKKGKKAASDDDDDAITALIDKYFGQMGFGGVLGVCSGYSMKKIGKVAAFLIGTGFIAVQTALHLGYVNISWTDVHKKAITALDTNKDGEFDKVKTSALCCVAPCFVPDVVARC